MKRLIILYLVLYIVQCKQLEQGNKWRCLFRCGTKKVQSFLGKEVNICQDVSFQFFLQTERAEKNSENKALTECTSLFEDISGDLYGQAKYFCNYTKCNPPIAKEILPPLDFREQEDRTEETKEKM